MREKIWYEMAGAKYSEVYIAFFLDRQKSRRNWIKILTLIFSTSGVFGWQIWNEGYFAMVSCVVVAFIQIISLIENHIVLNDADFNQISEVRTLYIDYFNKVEYLYIQVENNFIDEKTAMEKFYELRGIQTSIEVQMNKSRFNNDIDAFNKKRTI